MKNFKLNAFTLAEVLITLGIIGVVAAMTMPTLVQNYQKQAYVTGLRKGINILDNMRNKLMSDEEVTNFADTKLISEGYNLDCVASGYSGSDICGEDGYTNPSILIPELTKNFNVLKTCVDTECDVIYKGGYLSSNNKYVLYDYTLPAYEDFRINTVTNIFGIYTTDGMIYYFGLSANNSKPYMSVSIDVNGEKGPNQRGRDLFSCDIYSKGCVYGGDNFIKHMSTNGWKMDY